MKISSICAANFPPAYCPTCGAASGTTSTRSSCPSPTSPAWIRPKQWKKKTTTSSRCSRPEMSSTKVWAYLRFRIRSGPIRCWRNQMTGMWCVMQRLGTFTMPRYERSDQWKKKDLIREKKKDLIRELIINRQKIDIYRIYSCIRREILDKIWSLFLADT